MNSPARVSPRPRPRRGFALLVTIVLVAFLVLILVGLATFTRVETQVATNSQQLAAARQNALMALNIALGQLQQSAGPDQRVTAPAAILDSTPATSTTDGVAQPHWTAVWPTGAAGLDVVNSGTPQRQTSLGSTTPSIAQKTAAATWLVSNPTPAVALNPTTYAGVTSGASPDAVILARQIGATPNDVTVPLVPITIPAGQLPGFTATDTTATAIGRYAYWVSDEGVKAKVNLTDPTLGAAATTDTGLSHFFVPQANAMHRISSLVSGNTTDFRTDNSAAQLNRITGLNAVAFLPTTPATLDLKTLSPEITAVSRGVLANVAHGGLKKDLTAAFETPSEFTKLLTNHGYGANMLYRNDPALTVPSPSGLPMSGVTDGLPWLSLYGFYNLYKSTSPAPAGFTLSAGAAAPRTPSTSGSLSALPLVLSPRILSAGPAGSVVKLGGVTPEVIAFRLDIALEGYLSGGLYKLRLRYYPQLVLYNPYNCRISAADYQFQRNFGAFATAGTAVNITVAVSASPAIPAVTLNQASAGRFTLKTDIGQAAVLEPGETRVFGLIADVPTADPLAAITFGALSSSPTLSPDWSQYCDLPGFAGTADPNAVVTVTISDRRLRAQAADTFIVPHNYKWPFDDGSVRYIGGDGGDIAGDATSNWPGGLSISSMTSPRRLTGFFYRKKGLNNSAGTTSYASGATVIPPFHGNAPYFSIFDNKSSSNWGELFVSAFGTIYSSAISEVQQIPRSPGSPWETTFGDGSVGAAGTLSRRVLRDVPSQPLVSLGQFMHMPGNVFNSIGAYQYRDAGTMFTGGSLASPFIPTSATLQQGDPLGSFIILDDSFLANAALFDRFFFSTVPPSGATTPATWAAFNAANPGSGALADPYVSLPNNRIKPRYVDGAAPTLANLRDFDRAAVNLLLDGAFNVNAVSVNAWKAFLSGLSGNELRVFQSESRSSTTLSAATLRNPFPRFWSGSNQGNVNQPWEGQRSLTDTEITELATRIVEQVKLRGPFLSMADFLNRRLGPAGSLTRAGALQAAIDNTSPDINQAAKTAGSTVNASGVGFALATSHLMAPAIPTNLVDGAGNTLNSAVGMPGYLMQQDIVQACSAAMTVRSDSFVVRTYGESVNPVTGVSQGKAWAEAVVQRLPEFVDPSLAPETDLATAPASAATTTNQTFGRRFKVVGFRWLSPDDL